MWFRFVKKRKEYIYINLFKISKLIWELRVI